MRLTAFRGILLALAMMAAGNAEAASRYTYVSSTGIDGGACTPAAPCRTIQSALGQTTTNGEIHALNAADYGSAVITRSVKLIGVPGATMGRTNAGKIVDIRATAGLVEISGFIIEGGYNPSPLIDGIYSNSPILTVKNCIIRNVSANGIRIDTTTSGHSLIEDTTITRAGSVGILLNSTVNALDVAIDRVTIMGADARGIYLESNAIVRLVNSFITQSGMDAIFLSQPSSFLTVQFSSLLANGGYGVRVTNGQAFSAGNNSMIDNGLGKFFGTLTVLGLN